MHHSLLPPSSFLGFLDDAQSSTSLAALSLSPWQAQPPAKAQLLNVGVPQVVVLGALLILL